MTDVFSKYSSLYLADQKRIAKEAERLYKKEVAREKAYIKELEKKNKEAFDLWIVGSTLNDSMLRQQCRRNVDEITAIRARIDKLRIEQFYDQAAKRVDCYVKEEQ